MASTFRKIKFWLLALALVCIVATVAVSFINDRVRSESRTFDKIWTVELVGSGLSYKFRGPLITFLIHKSRDIDDWNRTVSGLPSVSFEWTYPDGEPRRLWKSKNPDSKLQNDFSVRISLLKPGKNAAEIAKYVYFDSRMNSKNPAWRPQFQESVWDGEASVYNITGTTVYLIEKRDEMDARIIYCTRPSTAYCTLNGARLTERLMFDRIMIPQDRVSEWKQYQRRARELVQAAMVDED